MSLSKKVTKSGRENQLNFIFLPDKYPGQSHGMYEELLKFSCFDKKSSLIGKTVYRCQICGFDVGIPETYGLLNPSLFFHMFTVFILSANTYLVLGGLF